MSHWAGQLLGHFISQQLLTGVTRLQTEVKLATIHHSQETVLGYMSITFLKYKKRKIQGSAFNFMLSDTSKVGMGNYSMTNTKVSVKFESSKFKGHLLFDFS